jgi:hypothetical protein
MKLIHVIAAAALIAVGASATAQPDKQPGGNVPMGQGPCTAGYNKAVKDGRMAKLSADTMKTVDTNNDKRISKQEFDAACAKKLFKEQDSKG